MRRHKKPTRRGRAIKWLTAAVLLLALCLGPGGFRASPRQAVRDAERSLGLSGMELVALADYGNVGGRANRYYLSAGNGALLAGQTRFWPDYRGWEDEEHALLELGPRGGFYVGAFAPTWVPGERVEQDGRELYRYTVLLYGCLEVPAGERVRIELQGKNIYEEEKPLQPLGEIEVTGENWYRGADGRTYFLAAWKTDPTDVYHTMWQQLQGQAELLDDRGRVLDKTEVVGKKVEW